MPTPDILAKLESSASKSDHVMNLVDFLSTVLLKQQGHIPEKSKATVNYFLKSSILASDVRQDPFVFIKMLANFMIHNAMLVDV